MGRAKIRRSTCEHARVRLFYPPILTSQDFARRSGNRDTKALRNAWPRQGQMAEMPQDSGAFSVDGGGYAAQVGRFGETTLPVFIPEQIVPYK